MLHTKKPGWVVALALLGAFLTNPALANQAPVVTDVVAEQREGTMLVDVTYNLNDADGDTLTVTLRLSDDGGQSFPIECVSVSGDIGPGVTSGTGKQIGWYAGVDYPERVGDDFIVQVKTSTR
jgi:hypothetical protein